VQPLFVTQRLYCSQVIVLFTLSVLALSPWLSFDPFSPIRMLFLSSLSGYFLLKIYRNRQKYSSVRYKYLRYWSLSWLLVVVLILINSKTSLILQFYGTHGRNIGIITTISLAIILIGFSLAAEKKHLNQVLLALVIIGGVTIFYGFAQTLNIDPFQISKESTPASSFFGNINFYSAIVGICCLALLGFIKESVESKLLMAGSFIYLMCGVVAIIQSQSQQGLFVLLIGSGTFALLLLLKKYIFGIKSLLPLISLFTSAGLFIAGFLQKGPLSHLLYQDSITYRGDYWRSGIRIIADHPLLGVGFDSFGDYYFRYRDLIAATRRGPLISTNSAHNYFIDYAAEGGFILLALYIAIIALTVLSYVKIFRREEVLNFKITALLAIWIGFQAQALISPRQISILVIGWAASGLIIGYEISMREVVGAKVNQTQGISSPRNLSKKSGAIAITLGAAISLPHFTADMQVKSAIRSLNLEKIYASAFRSPQDPNRMVYIANNLQAQGFDQEAIRILEQVVKIAPDNFDAWKLFSLVKTATTEQKSLATRNMKRLDPSNPDL
jgi:O-antigen ligase